VFAAGARIRNEDDSAEDAESEDVDLHGADAGSACRCKRPERERRIRQRTSVRAGDAGRQGLSVLAIVVYALPQAIPGRLTNLQRLHYLSERRL
jgi:hypothetical protein